MADKYTYAITVNGVIKKKLSVSTLAPLKQVEIYRHQSQYAIDNQLNADKVGLIQFKNGVFNKVYPSSAEINKPSRKQNPAPKSKRIKRVGLDDTAYKTRRSQITRKTPTKRLVERRAENLNNLGSGYFPNPSNRVTRSFIDARLALLAKLLKLPISGIGSLELYKDFTGYQIHQIANERRAVRTLSPILKLGEVSLWLDGAITVADARFSR